MNNRGLYWEPRHRERQQYTKNRKGIDLPGPPKEHKILAQYLKTESIGSIGSIILAILEVQVDIQSTQHPTSGLCPVSTWTSKYWLFWPGTWVLLLLHSWGSLLRGS